MTEFMTAILEDRGVVSATGKDVHKFLQGLISNDLDQIKPGSALFAGLLTPQGKILFDFFVIPVAEGYLIDISTGSIAAFVKRLKMYRLHADVSIEDVSADNKVTVGWGEATEKQIHVEAGAAATDPRHPKMGVRSVLKKNSSLTATSSSSDYHAHRIGLGIPEGGRDYVFSDTYPHEALYDDLNGVSFTKGCFIGQEVVSRMEHRKATKKRIVMVYGDQPLPSTGTDVVAGDIALGRLGTSHEAVGLALIRVDRMADVAKQSLTPKAQDVDLQIKKPDWASFEL